MFFVQGLVLEPLKVHHYELGAEVGGMEHGRVVFSTEATNDALQKEL